MLETNQDNRVTFTLNGKEIKATKGQTIWEVAKADGLSLIHI